MTNPGQKDTTRTWDRDENPEEKTAETHDSSKSIPEKRSEAKDTPFRGFGSPPGRF